MISEHLLVRIILMIWLFFTLEYAFFWKNINSVLRNLFFYNIEIYRIAHTRIYLRFIEIVKSSVLRAKVFDRYRKFQSLFG
jgi:hypothetical protein